MLVKLIEVVRGMRGGSASLKEIYLNPAHIISVSEDRRTDESLIQEAVNLGLSENISFSLITVQEGSTPRSFTIVGPPSEIYKKIRKKQILKG